MIQPCIPAIAWSDIKNFIDLSRFGMQPFLVVGIALIVTYIGTIVCEHFNIPKVMSFILFGFILGKSALKLITDTTIHNLQFISLLALSIIGFTIGGELVYNKIKELGASIPVITILESFGAFALVFCSVYLITHDVPEALLLGAMSAATAPAATVGVLWQYNAKGPLTTTLFAVVGLDDASSLIIYAFASTFAINLLKHAAGVHKSVFMVILKPMAEIMGAVLIGMIFAFILNQVAKRITGKEHLLIITLGTILICAGIAQTLGLSLILTNMLLGITLINITDRNRKFFDVIHDFNPPFYNLFLLLVGARLDISLVPHLGLVGAAYIVFRMAGKSLGAWLGAVATNAKPVIRKYLGFGLYSAAGVPIGLAIELSDSLRSLDPKLATVIVTVVIATLFIFESAGPLLAKRAVIQAGEVDEKYLQHKKAAG